MFSPFLTGLAYWLCIIGIAVVWSIYFLRSWEFVRGRADWRAFLSDSAVASLLTFMFSGIAKGLA